MTLNPHPLPTAQSVKGLNWTELNNRSGSSQNEIGGWGAGDKEEGKEFIRTAEHGFNGLHSSSV